jgi:hypothetical protein
MSESCPGKQHNVAASKLESRSLYLLAVRAAFRLQVLDKVIIAYDRAPIPYPPVRKQLGEDAARDDRKRDAGAESDIDDGFSHLQKPSCI